MTPKILHILALLSVFLSISTGELIVTSTETPKESEFEENISIPLNPVLYEMNILSRVSNRFAKTLVTSKVNNPNRKAQETTFKVVLPEKAFISEFVLRIGGKDYKAYVAEKETAEEIYKLAKLRGYTAGHVATDERDPNEFKISVNIEAEDNATFLLTFEELLERKNEQYELVLDVHPGQVVEKLSIEVHINESRPLRFVRMPSISLNSMTKEQENSNSTDIDIIEETSAIIKIEPDVEEQIQFAREVGGKESEGISGKFVVQYDVKRDPNGGEILLQDGYFVHFFAPDNLEPLPKHFVFVLDTSGSMGGDKLYRVKDAMNVILDQLQPEDYISLVEFNSGVYVWDLAKESRTVLMFDNYDNPFADLKKDYNLPEPLSAQSNDSINSTKHVVDKLYAGGNTNIIGGLETALVLIKTFADMKESEITNVQPIILFLTDGGPLGSLVDSTDEVFKIVTKLNSEYTETPIFALSFGDEAEKVFLRKLSLKNSGFSKHIFEYSFASFQLMNFYNEISVPLLSNITFEYADAANVTQTDHPVFFKGTEITICGTYDINQANPLSSTTIHGSGSGGDLSMEPTVDNPVSSLERLWAYLTVKQILGKRDTATEIEKIKLKNQALDLALKYSFVTEITSLVVVRPNVPEHRPLDPVDIQPRGLPGETGGHMASADIRVADADNDVVLSGDDRNFETDEPAEAYESKSYSSPLLLKSSYRTLSSRPLIHLRNKYEPATTYKPVFPVTTQSTTVEDGLTWLPSVRNANGTLSLKQGTYNLGHDHKTIKTEECPKTPISEKEGGICTLLKDCPEVYPHLTGVEVYEKYFCEVDTLYAGVCCPASAKSS